MGTYLTVQKFSEDRMLGVGKAISLSSDAAASQIKVAGTTRHYYEAGLPLLLENNEGYQEEAVVSTVVYGAGGAEHTINLVSALSDHTKFTTALTANVKVNQYFHALTIPSSSTVERWITRAERRIDEHCHTSWKGRTWGEKPIAYDPEVILGYIGDFSARYAIKLPYAGVTTPLVNGTDVLKYWDGTQYIDCLATGWTYGRDGDYWIEDDWLFFRKVRPRVSRFSIKMKFRYDEGYPPQDIEEACSKLVAREYLRGNNRNVEAQGKPAFGEAWPYQNGAPSWAEIKGILHPHVKLVYGV